MSFTIGAIVGGAIMLTGAVVQGVSASNAAKSERKKARSKEQQIADLEEGRQDVINPYSNMQDLSGMISNPYANLQVATQAADLQAEEADLSLASTLDTMRASGAGAGGATALAQAALRSKLGISASIQQQEAQNTRMRAQGQAQMNQQMMAEAQRMQQGDIAGQQFMFQAQEQRDVAQLNRLAGLQQGHQAAAAAYKSQAIGSIGQGTAAIGGALMGMSSPGAAPAAATCLTGDMRVISVGVNSEDYKYVRDVEVGDIIQTRDSSTARVTKTYSHIREAIYEIGDLRITDDHPIYIEDEWVLPEKIENSKLTKGDIEVYYIETDPGHFTVFDGSKKWNVSGDYDKNKLKDKTV